MKVRFQADADLDGRVIRGLRRIAPDLDIRDAHSAGLEGLSDPEVLHVAAGDSRILVSQDRRTMPAHFQRFVLDYRSSGVIILREAISIAGAIDDLVLIWSASHPEEWEDRLLWIPL